MPNFKEYAAYYDLLYRDKDYAGEARYVAERIRSFLPDARSILDLGSGTGRHGRLLAGMGFDVYGIERSHEMVALAGTSTSPVEEGCGTFACEVGNICSISLGRTFDVVTSLFHVISYQVATRDVLAAFQVAVDHLKPGGLFLFDVWHGPAVLMERPSDRVKEVSDDSYRVRRKAHSELNTNQSTVKVQYTLECENLASGSVAHINEDHLMRYFFPTEIDFLASSIGLRQVLFEESFSNNTPSPTTWSVTYGFQR